MVLTEPGRREVRLIVKTYVRSRDAERRLTPDEIVHLTAKISQASFQDAKPLRGLPILAADGDLDELDDIADDLVRSFSSSTNLVFGNAKQSLEIIADRLHQRAQRERWPQNPFIVHHGSLARDLRLEAEEILKSGRPTTALCSSTLEMGIDIGAVRAVGQVDPPWSVVSLVQRLGRSGRREGESSILRMYIREDSPNADSSITDLLFPDLLRAVALVRLMLAKWLEPVDFDRMHLSTLVHQILSVLKQSGGARAIDLHEALVMHGPFRRVPSGNFAQILRDLADHEIIEQMPQGELILAPAGERIAAACDFYAAFDAGDEFSVRCEDRDIGKLQSSLIPPVGENLILAGRRWRIDQIEAHAKSVLVSPARGGKPPFFRGGSGVISTRIVEEMRAVLLATDQPVYLESAGQKLLRHSTSHLGNCRCCTKRCSHTQWCDAVVSLDRHARAADHRLASHGGTYFI